MPNRKLANPEHKTNNTALILITATGSTEIVVGPPRNIQPTPENQAIIEFENDLARLYAHIARLDARLAMVAATVADIKSQHDK
ncbi:hypothetical protein RhiJN_13065 [Ceratobasidium sp. AG-Ba]|nr:hypothetical protein RhiJN_13065 [Ceratobasidium sp. AG-Ba]